MMNNRTIGRFFKAQGSEFPFFIFVTVILTGIYVLSVLNSPTLHNPLSFIIFTLLMIVHISLYWCVSYFEKSLRWILGYLILQGMLAFTLSLMGQNLALTIGLYGGLIGIASGLLKLTPWGLGMIGFFFTLSFISYCLVVGWDQLFWWLMAIIPMAVFVIIYVLLYNRQVEARDHAQSLLAELEIANRQLSDYAQRVQELTLVNERQRMAHELHDTLSQGLAGLILQLEAADAHLANGRPDRAQKIVQQTMERARETLANARRAIGDLRQEQAFSLNLAQALKQEAARFNEATGIPCSLVIDLPVPIPQNLSDTVCRTVSEGLTNVARHAQASQVDVHVLEQDQFLQVFLHDNGVGFDPQNAVGQPGHFGLLGMVERARLVNGVLEVISQFGKGTTLHLRLPLAEDPPMNSSAGG
jgi:two-component system, NarL family, sensor histidine kinase YdfH